MIELAQNNYIFINPTFQRGENGLQTNPTKWVLTLFGLLEWTHD